MTPLRDTGRSMLGILDDFWTDVRLALRTWRRNLGLAVVVTTILTVGIGISSTAVTLIIDEYFRPSVRAASDPDAGSYAQAYLSRTTRDEAAADFRRFTVEDVEAIQRHAKSLRSAAWRPVSAPMGEDMSALVRGKMVTCNFFAVEGLVRPLLGRFLDESDCATAARVAVISESMWRRRFGADPEVIGRVVSYNLPLTIVGVAPGAGSDRLGPGLFIPYTVAPANQPPLPRVYRVAGRLAPGYTRPAAAAELSSIIAQLDARYPGRRSQVAVTGGSAPNDQAGTWAIMLLLLGVVTMVVLLVCTNAATLVLSRAHARRHEIAVRLSLGAGLGRLMRMLVTETLLLALIAAGLSVVIAHELPQLLVPLLDTDPARTISPDRRVWLFLAGITLLAALASGLAPALEALRADTARSLKQRPGASDGRGRFDLRGFLVVAQISIAVALLGGAGVFMRSYLRTTLDDPGFETRKILLSELGVWGAQAPSWPAIQPRIAAEVSAVPGVENVAFAESRPATGDWRTLTSAAGLSGKARFNGVSSSFFATIGVSLLRGRALQPDDPVTGGIIPVVVSQRLADHLMPGLDPLGQVLRAGDGSRFSVVGVVRDIFEPGRRVHATLYRPLRPEQDILLVRFAGDPLAVAKRVGDAIRRASPGIFGRPRVFQSTFDHDIDEIGDLTALGMILGICALLIASLGVYGVVSFAAQRRTKELAIRAALGGRGRDIVRALTAAPIRQLAVGLTSGLAMALLLAAAGNTFAKNIRPSDPLPYAVAILLVTTAALLAMLRPAHRAMTADPIAALREE
jgi:putative ABC transport system permease protein